MAKTVKKSVAKKSTKKAVAKKAVAKSRRAEPDDGKTNRINAA